MAVSRRKKQQEKFRRLLIRTFDALFQTWMEEKGTQMSIFTIVWPTRVLCFDAINWLHRSWESNKNDWRHLSRWCRQGDDDKPKAGSKTTKYGCTENRHGICPGHSIMWYVILAMNTYPGMLLPTPKFGRKVSGSDMMISQLQQEMVWYRESHIKIWGSVLDRSRQLPVWLTTQEVFLPHQASGQAAANRTQHLYTAPPVPAFIRGDSIQQNFSTASLYCQI